MFEAIGTLHSYAQQQNLLKSVNVKKKTGVSLDQLKEQAKEIARQNDSLVDKMLKAQKSADDEASKQRVSSIKNKLLAGKKLSQTEIEYLRDKDPKLYKKAKAADDARNELKAALKRAKTKQEARMALTQAMVKASSEAMTEISAAKANMNASASGASGGNDIQNEIPNDLSNGNQTSEQNSSQLLGENSELISEQSSQSPTQSSTQIFAQTSDQNQTDEIKMEIAGENLEESNEIQEEQNSEIKNSEVENLDENSESEKTSDSNEVQKSSEDDKDTPQDIMEKYIMIFRALENEFVEFMKTDHAKKLPEDKPKDVVKIPSTKLHDMMTMYRMQMNFKK